MSLKKKLTKKVPNHLCVVARAGTGKTTTMIEGLNVLFGNGSKFTPSKQQKAIWDEIKKSKDAKSVTFCCFNKSIQKELERKVPEGCQALTMHSMGFRAVQSAFGKIKPDSWRTTNIICEMLGMTSREARKKKGEVLRATEKLVSLCKQNLLDGTPENLHGLVAYYDIEIDKGFDEVLELVPRVMERSKNVEQDRSIHFDDMIWLPVVLDLHVPRSELLLVDEAQDLNRCQQSLAKKAGKRIIFIGDPKQAIYGFAGADAESMNRLQKELSETPQGCKELPLTMTYRCGKAIVEKAKLLVSDFEAHESNGEGMVDSDILLGESTDGPADYAFKVQDGKLVCALEPETMILCRCNAPLVSQCFRFIREGIKATIRGRDIGKGLVQLVMKLSKQGSQWNEDDRKRPIDYFLNQLSDWNDKETEKESEKKNPSDSKLMNIADKYQTLICFTEEASNVGELIEKIELVFSDDSSPGIQLSSIHKAKGLEARKVIFLQPKEAPCPHPMAKTALAQEQENNLLYVAYSRAIEELVIVS